MLAAAAVSGAVVVFSPHWPAVYAVVLSATFVIGLIIALLRPNLLWDLAGYAFQASAGVMLMMAGLFLTTAVDVLMLSTNWAGVAFFVVVAAREVSVIVATSRYGNKYLKTEADGEEPNNLLSLPECP